MSEGARKAIVIRTGERGILVFDPVTSVFSFLKQDAKKSLVWERLPFPSVR
jgi:hypothetical protein